jgi:hypothetical protein
MTFFPESSKRESPLVPSKDSPGIDWRLAILFVTSLVLCWPATSTQAQDVSRADVGKWLDTRPSAPNFKADDVLSSGDLERLRPFVPPGYLEQLNFPSFKMKANHIQVLTEVLDPQPVRLGVMAPDRLFSRFDQSARQFLADQSRYVPHGAPDRFGASRCRFSELPQGLMLGHRAFPGWPPLLDFQALARADASRRAME